jgi:hypothetical protein
LGFFVVFGKEGRIKTMSNLKVLAHPLIEEYLVSDIEDFQEFLDSNSYRTEISDTEKNAFYELKKQLDVLKQRDYVKNQHYVPQFYLNQFTNSDKRLETLDLRRKVITRAQSPKHVCSGIFFYSVFD